MPAEHESVLVCWWVLSDSKFNTFSREKSFDEQLEDAASKMAKYFESDPPEPPCSSRDRQRRKRTGSVYNLGSTGNLGASARPHLLFAHTHQNACMSSFGSTCMHITHTNCGVTFFWVECHEYIRTHRVNPRRSPRSEIHARSQSRASKLGMDR